MVKKKKKKKESLFLHQEEEEEDDDDEEKEEEYLLSLTVLCSWPASHTFLSTSAAFATAASTCWSTFASSSA